MFVQLHYTSIVCPHCSGNLDISWYMFYRNRTLAFRFFVISDCQLKFSVPEMHPVS